MGMQTALEKLLDSADGLEEGRGPGTKARNTEKLKVIEKRMAKRFPNRVASVEMNERFIISFMRWGEDNPRLWVLDTRAKQIHRPTQHGPALRILASRALPELLSILDEERIFRFLEEY